MLFNVAQLLKDPIGSTREFDLDEGSDLLADVPARARYIGHVKIIHINEGALVEAVVRTTAEVDCSRCLRPVEVPLQFKFTEEYRPTIDLATGLPVPVREGEEFFRIDESHTLDLTEAVRQYALLNLPPYALCREDCAGLCPSCGQDLNQGRCECAKEQVDPRLAVLAQLLGDSERS
jgi:uncharacterized protein